MMPRQVTVQELTRIAEKDVYRKDRFNMVVPMPLWESQTAISLFGLAFDSTLRVNQPTMPLQVKSWRGLQQLVIVTARVMPDTVQPI